MSWFRQLRARQFDDARSRAFLPSFENSFGQLMKVISSTPISATDKRFVYSVRKHQVGTAASKYVAVASTDTTLHNALSVSELSNALATYSYGVVKANIPAGFTAQKIPDNTLVWCVPHRTTDGDFLWLIINTQAIDGVC